MDHFFRPKILTILFVSCSFSAFSQLVGSSAQLWEKANSTSREAVRCNDENLLNFHCGIKDKLLRKYIKYSKNNSQTLSVVHRSKEDELVWENAEKNVSLGNNFYKSGPDQASKISKRPSIFTFTGTADPTKGKTDSLKIKFEDQNLYEIIFLPKKAKILDLNKIHSYLSIKYGISLEKGKYYTSEGIIIWDPEKHKDFRYRPTGLGRDDGNELYQKQSSNQADSFLTIGKNDIKRTNIDNLATWNNYDFVIWSDDNKQMTLKKDGNFEVLERNWEINFIGPKVLKTDYKVRIQKGLVNPASLPTVYWMLLKNKEGKIQKIQGVEKENYIVFSNVDFISDFENDETAQFTFAISPLKDQKAENAASVSVSPINYNDFSIDLSKIVLYPNPVKKGQNFTIVFPPMENLEISIYDGAGRLVKMEGIGRKSTHYVGQLGVQSGYIINLTQNGKIIKTFKLIVD